MNANIVNALANPNRFQIVDILQSGPLTVGEISERLEMRQPQASKHLRVLLEARIVQVHAEANRRFYSLQQDPFREIDDWLKSFSRILEDRFERLDQHLQEFQEKQRPDMDQG